MANIADKIRGIIKKGDTAHEDIICNKCKQPFPYNEMTERLFICPSCNAYVRIPPYARIKMLTDPNSFKELYSDIKPKDALLFPQYRDKLDKAMKITGENEGVVVGSCKIEGVKCDIFCMDTRFVMASLSGAMGEKITRIFEHATTNKLPVIGIIASGGARMQEGILSLMQMAKCSGAIKRHSEKGNMYISLLTDPTTGGVTASIAMLSDITLAEPKALIGFAGKRVIEQTTGEKLPDDFQSAEFMFNHGFVDAIVERADERKKIASILKLVWGDKV